VWSHRYAVARSLIPTALVGAWTAVLWHRYIVELGAAIYTWKRGGVFDVVSTAAFGAAGALVTFLVVHKPTAPLAEARVPQWWHRVSFRALVMTTMVAALGLLDRVIVPLSDPPPPRHAEVIAEDASVPVEEVPAAPRATHEVCDPHGCMCRTVDDHRPDERGADDRRIR
jgi:hypothetical protein